MTLPISQAVDTLAARTSTSTFITLIRDRAPTGNDGINNAFQVTQRWIDTSNNNAEWFLLNFTSSNGVVQANWISLSNAGSGDLLTLSDDIGTLVTPLANNIQLVGHINEQGSTKFSTVTAGSNLLNLNPMSSARWIVDPLGFNGTHTTIASAIAAATEGDTVFVLPGTYTENLTLKVGVNISAHTGDAYTPNVIIKGTCTYTGTGSISLSGISLTTNSDYALVVSGSAISLVHLINCSIVCLDHTGIQFTSSDSLSTLSLYNCIGNLFTTGISLYSHSSSGVLYLLYSLFNDAGLSTNLSDNSKGLVYISNSIVNIGLSTSGTGTLSLLNSTIFTRAINTICLTATGTSRMTAFGSSFTSGTASAISVGAGTIVNVASCVVNSTNTNVFTGAGTINTGGNVCISSSGNNVSTSNSYVVI